jgi:Spy/CpxP family protein refolding chaperone
MAANIKVVLAVGGIFLTGAITGGFAGFRLGEHYAKPPPLQPRGNPVELLGGRAAEQLNLTPEQKKQIRPIIGRTSEELRSISRDAFSRSGELIAKMDSELAKILTPEQFDKLREIRAKESERRRQWMKDRPKPLDGRPSGGPSGNHTRPPRPSETPEQPAP